MALTAVFAAPMARMTVAAPVATSPPAKTWGMPPDQLFRKGMDDIQKTELPLLLCNTGEEDDLQEKVAQLFFQPLRSPCLNGFERS
jgi:hypothetical protein